MKKTLLPIAALLLVVAVLLLLQPSPAPVAPEMPVQPFSPDPYEAAIDAALRYLVEDAPPSWQVYALLDYLQRRFDLGERYAIAHTFHPDNHPEYDLEMVPLMGRLTEPDHVPPPEALARRPVELNGLMVAAMYCDHYPVNAAYVEEILGVYEKDLARGAPGYIATHVILCLQWMRELGCDAAFPEIADRWDDFAEALVAIAEREKAATDLAFESMAFLYYIGYGHRVCISWLDTMVALQRPTGAWAYTPDIRDRDHGHPTVLALWALLEFTREGMPSRPMLEPRVSR